MKVEVKSNWIIRADFLKLFIMELNIPDESVTIVGCMVLSEFSRKTYVDCENNGFTWQQQRDIAQLCSDAITAYQLSGLTPKVMLSRLKMIEQVHSSDGKAMKEIAKNGI